MLQGNLLLGSFPNPFDRSALVETNVRFYLADTQKVEIAVYNIRGQRVRMLQDNRLDQGYHSVRWDGNDESGRTVASGVYFLRMNTSGQTKIKKLILFK